MGIVIKRNGKKVAFNASKIRNSILKAAHEAGLSASRIKELTQDVAESVINEYKNKKTKAIYLRKIILKGLDRKSRSVSNAWRRFDKKRR